MGSCSGMGSESRGGGTNGELLSLVPIQVIFYCLQSVYLFIYFLMVLVLFVFDLEIGI